MIPPIEFFVPGIPAPAGSKRSFAIRRGGVYTGRTATMDACKRTKPWQATVSHFAAEAFKGEILTGPLRADFIFKLPRPQGHYRTGKNAHTLRDSAPKFPASKPDGLKLARAVEDALTGIIYKDDAQIVTGFYCKRYAGFGEQPGVWIAVKEVCE